MARRGVQYTWDTPSRCQIIVWLERPVLLRDDEGHDCHGADRAMNPIKQVAAKRMDISLRESSCGRYRTSHSTSGKSKPCLHRAHPTGQLPSSPLRRCGNGDQDFSDRRQNFVECRHVVRRLRKKLLWYARTSVVRTVAPMEDVPAGWSKRPSSEVRETMDKSSHVCARVRVGEHPVSREWTGLLAEAYTFTHPPRACRDRLFSRGGTLRV